MKKDVASRLFTEVNRASTSDSKTSNHIICKIITHAQTLSRNILRQLLKMNTNPKLHAILTVDPSLEPT